MQNLLKKSVGTRVMPRQPLMVMAAEKYYVYRYGKFGISHFYSFTAATDSGAMDAAQVVPDGSSDIVFHCGDGYRADCYGTRLYSHGLVDIPTIQPGSRMFGIRFYQGQAYLPNNFPEAELTENRVNMYAIMRDHQTLDRICRSKNFMEQIQIFLSMYLNDYCKFTEMSMKNYAVDYMLRRMMESRGLVKQKDLSDETKYSVRYLNELFTQNLGVSPKAFCRMIQYQYLISLLNTGSNLSDVAFKAGFYDQAHFIHEFKLFTNMTPTCYLKKLHNSGYEKKLVVMNQQNFMSHEQQTF
ncbi:MAG TPA: hypothetical protein DHW78_05835 [Ruminococcaceae bacterium]|mgnify:FL=1|jgi:AraC-like DNA-binding protein|nr:helix-turn-helix domain-containing protein [Oscillospiraceae bacterium]HCM23826.1 hypothetical protein [Oscillospiraceae bacterium]